MCVVLSAVRIYGGSGGSGGGKVEYIWWQRWEWRWTGGIDKQQVEEESGGINVERSCMFFSNSSCFSIPVLFGGVGGMW